MRRANTLCRAEVVPCSPVAVGPPGETETLPAEKTIHLQVKQNWYNGACCGQFSWQIHFETWITNNGILTSLRTNYGWKKSDLKEALIAIIIQTSSHENLKFLKCQKIPSRKIKRVCNILDKFELNTCDVRCLAGGLPFLWMMLSKWSEKRIFSPRIK